ncbi:hypothetical protein EYF80_001095 [Liparis tanakae]|uniref:Uncharacterized protein n=1 Tax=Liparis tanakae TaxID=230148 RepID=A0A4Z2JG00_9TELE|nr:hypothetical protein EYF80_001095 [Liparis tanakae]
MHTAAPNSERTHRRRQGNQSQRLRDEAGSPRQQCQCKQTYVIVQELMTLDLVPQSKLTGLLWGQHGHYNGKLNWILFDAHAARSTPSGAASLPSSSHGEAKVQQARRMINEPPLCFPLHSADGGKAGSQVQNNVKSNLSTRFSRRLCDSFKPPSPRRHTAADQNERRVSSERPWEVKDFSSGLYC